MHGLDKTGGVHMLKLFISKIQGKFKLKETSTKKEPSLKVSFLSCWRIKISQTISTKYCFLIGKNSNFDGF